MTIPQHLPSSDKYPELEELKALTEQTRREADERILKTNSDIMHSNQPGGMAYQFGQESWGGNAGSEEVNGVRVTKVAANLIIDTETGEIVTFTDSPEEYRQLLRDGHNVTELTFIKAISRMNFQDRQVSYEPIEGWSRPQNIIRIFGRLGETGTNAKLEEFLPERAVTNLYKAVDAYNNEVHPFVL